MEDPKSNEDARKIETPEPFAWQLERIGVAPTMYYDIEEQSAQDDNEGTLPLARNLENQLRITRSLDHDIPTTSTSVTTDENVPASHGASSTQQNALTSLWGITVPESGQRVHNMPPHLSPTSLSTPHRQTLPAPDRYYDALGEEAFYAWSPDGRLERIYDKTGPFKGDPWVKNPHHISLVSVSYTLEGLLKDSCRKLYMAERWSNGGRRRGNKLRRRDMIW